MLWVFASGASAASCRRAPEHIVTVEEAQSLGHRGDQIARRLVRERPYVAPGAFVPTAIPAAERDAAIESLVRGREAAAKKKWPEAREALDEARRGAPFDDEIREERDRAARGDAPRREESPTSIDSPRPMACTVLHPTIEDLCTCLVTSDEGEHCLPIPVPCSFVGQQTRDGSMFVLRVGRDDELGLQPRYVVGAREGDAFRAVATIASEWGVRGDGHSRDDTEITTEPARTDDGRVLFRIDVRQSAYRAGLVDVRYSMTKRVVFCLPPTPTEPARCPVDVVANRRATRDPVRHEPPLPPKLAARLSAVTAPFAPVFVVVGREITDTGIRTWLIDGKLDELPRGTVGFHPFR